jgi:hypothetical protein
VGKLMQWQAWIRSSLCCQRIDLHSIVSMVGFRAVKLWQNETFHFHNQMNMIIVIHEWERRKYENCRVAFVAEVLLYLEIEMKFRVGVCVIMSVSPFLRVRLDRSDGRTDTDLSSLRTIDRYAGTKDGRSICEERFGK